MSEAKTQSEFEAIWAEIHRLLEWQQGFGFYLVFSDDQRAAKALKQRVEDATRLRTGLLQWVRPETPETAVQAVLEAIFQPDSRYDHWHAPLWVELTAGPEDAAWQKVRRQALSALNRRRSALEQDCLRPLFLQLPEAMAPEVVTWAPDLWSVRQYIALLPALPENALVSAQGDEAPILDKSLLLSATADVESLTQEDMQRAIGHAKQDIEALHAQLNLRGHTPDLVRHLSVALGKLGELEMASGNMLATLAAYRESLDLCRQLRSALGDTPQVLRDLSVSLNKVGNVERDSGNANAALAAYRESLDLCRQLRSALGDTPQVLRKLSYTLHLIADAEAVFGNDAASAEAKDECEAISARLQASGNEAERAQYTTPPEEVAPFKSSTTKPA
jgi:tetratricopeptide (TPR) repeat protein